MNVEMLPHSHEQLSWEFLDVTASGGTIALIWDKTVGAVAFKAGR
jgi:hypothetical protein